MKKCKNILNISNVYETRQKTKVKKELADWSWELEDRLKLDQFNTKVKKHLADAPHIG